MDRQELMLAAMAAGGQGARYEPVQVQKLFFLIDMEVAASVGGKHFAFKPYDYGPFDSDVYSELEAMSKVGLVKIDAGYYRTYSLTPVGQERGVAVLGGLDARVNDFIQRSAKWVRSLSFRQLVSAIYKKYPDMKKASVFRE